MIETLWDHITAGERRRVKVPGRTVLVEREIGPLDSVTPMPSDGTAVLPEPRSLGLLPVPASNRGQATGATFPHVAALRVTPRILKTAADQHTEPRFAILLSQRYHLPR